MVAHYQSEDLSNDETKVANMCVTAFDDLDEVSSHSDLDGFMIEYEELLKDTKKFDEKNTLLKKKFWSFKNFFYEGK